MPIHAGPMPARRSRRLRSTITALAAAAAALVTSQAPSTAHAALVADPWLPMAPKAMTGWQADFVDNFSGSLNTSTWGRYNGGTPTGTVSSYAAGNVAVSNLVQVNDGVLQVSTRKVNGAWTTGGVSSGRGFSAVQGKWVIKAKFDRAPGVGYAFLLMPKGGGWPPEIDIAEGTMGGPHIMSTFHYGTASNHQQTQRWLKGVNMSNWHTYGVIISGKTITYTLDGRAWGSVTSSATPTVPMWLGLQTGVKDCAQSTGECLSGATPTSANITVDWVAHYRKV